MRSRPRSSGKTSARAVACALDLVCLTIERRELLVLLQSNGAIAPRLPSMPWRGAGTLDDAAGILTRDLLGREAAWREQVGASAAGAHPNRSTLSIVFAALVPHGVPTPHHAAWHDVGDLPSNLPARHRTGVGTAVAHIRDRMDQAPVAFRLLPPIFTLGDLQVVYELLLGRRLHKASFRRALQAAYLVEPTEEWRSEGRGRPAQFFRYAPRRRKGTRRTVRFELLGG